MLSGTLAAEALTLSGPLVLGSALVLAGAVFTAGAPARRGIGLVVGVAGMLPAWLVPAEHSAVRFLWALLGFAGAMRCADLCRGRWTLKDRVIHVLSVVDTRRLVQATPSLDTLAVVQVLGWGLLGLPACYGLDMAPYRYPTSVTDWLMRWSFGLVLVYALSAGAYRLLHLAYRAVGFSTPPLHIAPAAARSVQEFWGERWNRTVGTWLLETFFRPLARRRSPLLGAFAAFLASALVHAYLAWVAVGGVMATWMLVFFLSQAFIIFAERRLGVRKWAPSAGHAWTVAWMAALSPLFTEGMVRVIFW